MAVLYQNIRFHNVSELAPLGGFPGHVIHRFPKEVRDAIAPDIADLCRSVELRFRVPADSRALETVVYLMARNCDGEAAIYFGDYLQGDVTRLPVGVITPVKIKYNPALDAMPRGRFDNRLCRVFLNARASINYIGTEGGDLTPPNAKDEPDKTIVCYGSSITHGGLAHGNLNAYIQQAARRLKVDVLNLGMSGSCRAESAITRFLAKQEASAFVIELGANMVRSVSPDDFTRRARDMLYTLAMSCPTIPVVVTTMFPRGGMDDAMSASYRAFNAALRDICAQSGRDNLRLLEGDALLDDVTGLSADLTHPSDWGHMLIGEKLAAALQPLIT